MKRSMERFYHANLDTIRGSSVNLVRGKLTFPVTTVQSEVVRTLLPVDKLTEPPGEVTSFFPAVVRPVGKVDLRAPLNSLGHGIRHQTLCNQNKKRGCNRDVTIRSSTLCIIRRTFQITRRFINRDKINGSLIMQLCMLC